MFVRNKVFSQRRLLKRCKILFYKPYVYFHRRWRIFSNVWPFWMEKSLLSVRRLFNFQPVWDDMRWPNPSVCQRLVLEKETFRCDSCFPYKVHFLYIKDIWFAFPKYVQLNLSLTSSLARPAQLSVVFEVNTIHQSNFQSTSLVIRKDTWIYEDKKYKALKKSLKNKEVYLPKLLDCRTTWFYCVWRHRRHHDDLRRQNLLIALAQCTVSHPRSSSTKSSSWFLSSLF